MMVDIGRLGRNPHKSVRGPSAPVERTQLVLVQLARLVLEHDRYAVADRESQARGAADQLLARRIVNELGLGARAHQDLEQARVDAVGACRRLGLIGHGLGLLHCSVVPGPSGPAASSISAKAIKASARALRLGASSSACFSSEP